jgi:predicted Rossmann fold nucleotide-binding protein DprA/Smf involved in DNA uptake
MNKKAIIYSLDEKIKLSELKKLENFNIDKLQEEKFLKYCNENGIKSLVGKDIFLKKTKNNPYILYYMWDYEILKNKKLIWIVWPRQTTFITVQFVKDFFNKIKNLPNIAIVSY